AEYDLAWLRTYAATWAGREDWFDGLFDRAWPAREALDAILRAGRAYSVRFGSTIGFVRDEPKQVRRVAFTPDNIVKGSVQFHYRFEGESAPDHLLVRYLDSEIWRERTVKAAINVIGDEEPEEVELFGVTDHDHAW